MAYINGKENFVILVPEAIPTYNGEVAISSGDILGQNLKGKTVLLKFATLDGVTLEDTQLFYIDENNKVEVNEIYDNYYYYDEVYFGGISESRDATTLDSITYTFPDEIDAIVTKYNSEIVTVEIVEVINKDDIVVTLNSGQTATIKSKGVKMESDIVVKAIGVGGGIDLANIPEVDTIDNPTESSPSAVKYNGEIYLLIKE